MFDRHNLALMLSKVQHFKMMQPEERLDIIASGRVKIYPKGAVIFAEGEPCAGMFVLLKGQVHLEKLGPEGKKQILSVITPVIMFNEVPVLDGGLNLATAIASQDCVAWWISCESFQSLLERFPQMGIGLLHILAARNRLLISQYEDLSFRSVVARTAKLLLEMSQEGQIAINRSAHPNVHLAALIAAGPESFSRSLSMLRNYGYIECSRDAIHVTHIDALADLAFVDIR